MVQNLPADAIVVWCYYQAMGDPDPDHDDPIPAYPSFGREQLSLQGAMAYPSTNAREWSRSNFIWRRCGVDVDGVALTFHIWEGTSCTGSIRDAADSLLASVVVT